MSKTPWETPGYSDVVAAGLDGEMLHVRFENGDEVTLELRRLGLADAIAAAADPEDATKVAIRTTDGELDLDWTQVRSSTDPEFARELRRRDAEEAQRVGRRLKALREDRELRQDEVAQQAGMTAPQLSKIERGQSDLRISTLTALLRVMNADFAAISGPHAPEHSRLELVRSGARAGLPRELFERLIRAVPREQVSQMLESSLGWSTPALVAGEPLPALAAPVNFKAARRQQPADSPLLHLAFAAGALAAKCARVPISRPLPRDPSKLRADLLGSAPDLTFETLLRGAWERGIVVIPMQGAGGFSAAAWNASGRPAVVLKESRALVVYWIFDLAHELAHHALGHALEAAIVDIEHPVPTDTDEIERQANAYALELLLPGHEELVAAVRSDSLRGEARLRFKFAVERVAQAHRVSTSLLAMISAYALSDVAEEKDRWGSATNLAKPEGPGAPVAQQIAADYLDLERLEPLEAAIVRSLVGP